MTARQQICWRRDIFEIQSDHKLKYNLKGI
jgi:hypothetical protein